MEKRNVIIFTRKLLPLSETFIREPAEAMEKFTAIYAGRRRVPGLELDPARTFVINRGGILGLVRETLFQFSRMDRRLRDSLARLNPVLCHAHFEGGGIAVFKLARALRVPLVVNCHGFDVTARDASITRNPLLRPWYRGRRRQLQAGTDLFLACSHFLKTRMVQRGYPEERIIVHYIGIDTAKFAPDPAVARERMILFVARLVEKKGCEYLLRAMAEVQQKQPDAELVVIGDGPLRASLEAQAQQSVPRSRFLGAQPGDVIRQWLKRASIFSVPSVTAASGDAEGLGIVFLEAQASGVPCASFRHGGIPEAVADGETGLLADERDWRGLAANILRLLEDRALWERLSTAGVSRMRATFDMAMRTRLLERTYEDTIGESRRAV